MESLRLSSLPASTSGCLRVQPSTGLPCRVRFRYDWRFHGGNPSRDFVFVWYAEEWVGAHAGITHSTGVILSKCFFAGSDRHMQAPAGEPEFLVFCFIPLVGMSNLPYEIIRIIHKADQPCHLFRKNKCARLSPADNNTVFPRPSLGVDKRCEMNCSRPAGKSAALLGRLLVVVGKKQFMF